MGIEKLTTLALSMYSNKGAYALLLGSGISRSAHIPSGWEVEEKLIQKLAAVKGVTESKDWHQWYKETYKKTASYSSLLENLNKKPTERVSLMKPFFEPTDEEKKLDWKIPTKAHIAIARLAKEGYIRVILTTNFDRLLEKAFEKESVTPQVISYESAIEQATPIVHSKTPTIIKINGDYIDCQFRNTTDELDKYPEEMESYLQCIFEDFGLITCGWSGLWDKGLIEIINKAHQSRYNSFFTYVGKATDSIQTLSQKKGGEIMPIENADILFSELYEQVTALKKLDLNVNMSNEMMIAKVKKYLSSKQYNIDFADLIEKWGIDAYNQIIEVSNYNFKLTKDKFDEYLDIHLHAINPLLDAVLLTARWGKEWHLKLFGDVLVKLCMKPILQGEYENTRYLHSLAPMLLLNALGIACVKYKRFKELDYILKLSVPRGNFEGLHRYPLLYLLGKTHWDDDQWHELLQNRVYYPFSYFFLHTLKPIFKDYFITDEEYENVFHIWEHLKSLIYGYNKCSLIGFNVPMGLYFRQRVKYVRNQESEPYTIFFEEADSLKNNWEPIKQGMFGGSYDQYKEIYDKVEEYYNENRTDY